MSKLAKGWGPFRLAAAPALPGVTMFCYPGCCSSVATPGGTLASLSQDRRGGSTERVPKGASLCSFPHVNHLIFK